MLWIVVAIVVISLALTFQRRKEREKAEAARNLKWRQIAHDQGGGFYEEGLPEVSQEPTIIVRIGETLVAVTLAVVEHNGSRRRVTLVRAPLLPLCPVPLHAGRNGGL